MKRQSFWGSLFPKRIDVRFIDYKLLTAIIILTIVGLSFLYSASSAISYAKSLKNNLPPTTAMFFKKQLLWSLIAITIMLFVVFIDLEKIRKHIPVIAILTIASLIIVLFMPKIQNTRRWINLVFFNFQPSEFAKVMFVLYISDYIDRNYSKIRRFKYLLKPFLVISIILVLIALEPDLGTPALIFISMLIIFFIYGAKTIHIITPLIIGSILIVLEINRHSYRAKRVTAFLSSFSELKETGFQLAQSLVAIGSGWWFGKGPGNSIMKLNYLPESHTDFIFPIIAEEIGFIGTTLIIFVFVYIFLRAVNIAKNSKSSFLSILTISSIIIIIIQAFFNMAMTVGMIPTKGLPLPFFSYGGSSIIVTMILMGFILNASLRRKRI
ncbi:MAG: putative lipid II flippase FtsW [Elusimicrobiota bacterium]